MPSSHLPLSALALLTSEPPRNSCHLSDDAGRSAAAGTERPLRYRYCPLESGETVEVTACATCSFLPEPPFRICAAPRVGRPRRRGFWDREPSPLDG